MTRICLLACVASGVALVLSPARPAAAQSQTASSAPASASDQAPAEASAHAHATSSSEYAPQARLTGGLVAGIGFVNMAGDADVVFAGTSTPLASYTEDGLSVGGYLTFQLDHRWGARIGVRYSQRGAGAQPELTSGDDGGGGGGGFDSGATVPVFEFQIAYVQVPLMVTYTIPYDGQFIPYVFGGPDLAILLTSEVSGSGSTFDEMGNVTGSFNVSRDAKDATGTFDVGLTAGIGMKFGLPAGRLVLDARYLVSVTEAVGAGQTELAQGITLEPKGLRNHGLLVSAGYEF